jgi:phosphatidylinositol alpha-mannosyltransferase
MRVGLVCPYSLTLPGGVQGQVLGLARSLRAMGHEARVLAPCDGPPPELFVTPLGNSLPTAANGSIAPLAPDPSASLRTIRALRDEAFDVLHLHEPVAPGPTTTATIVHPAPIVGTFHAAGDSAGYRLLNPAVRWLAGRIDLRCAVSPDAAALAERYLGGRYDVLFNGIELAHYRAVEPVKASGPTIFFCGRHEPRKGLEVLLDALQRLPVDVRLWVASDGPDTTRLQARYAGDPRVEWLGRISETEKVARLRGASVFCAPALGGESFGVVLLEAMAAGTPVVASDIAGYRNVAAPGIDAVMVAPDDPAALAGALRRVLADDDLARSLCDAATARVAAFSMDLLAELYLERYRAVLRDDATVAPRREGRLARRMRRSWTRRERRVRP